MTQFVIAAPPERLHQDVAGWLALHGKTPWPLAWKTADRVVAEKADPVVYLTAAQLLHYRDEVQADALEYVRIP